MKDAHEDRGLEMTGSGRRLEPAVARTLSAMLLLMPAAASPQAVNDPMRPPGLEAVVESGEGPTGGGLTLQTVMISPTYKAAIINGVLVKLGEKIGEAELVAVEESHVVLKTGTTKEVLKFPTTVVKSESKPAAAKKAAARGR